MIKESQSVKQQWEERETKEDIKFEVMLDRKEDEEKTGQKQNTCERWREKV